MLQMGLIHCVLASPWHCRYHEYNRDFLVVVLLSRHTSTCMLYMQTYTSMGLLHSTLYSVKYVYCLILFVAAGLQGSVRAQ